MYNILICDDEEDIVRALKIYLLADNKDYNIIEASNGRQAIEKFEESGNIDLILMDVMMPEMDGVEALCEIRKTSEVPVILLTAKSEAEDKRMAFRLGVDDYITKPFNKIEVAARVEYQLRRAEKKNAAKNRSDRSQTGPDRVRRSHRKRLHGDGQEPEAERS